MKEYAITGVFSFTQNAESPSEISDALKKIILREGFNDKNFEITVERVTPYGKSITISEEETALLEQAGELPKKKAVKEETKNEVEVTKKRRGRPPKNGNKVPQNKKTNTKFVKRKIGRTRKNR